MLNGTKSGQQTVTPVTEKKTETSDFKVGDLVRITGAKYYGGQTIPAWVKAKNWYVKSLSGTRIVIDKSEDGKNAICSPVNSADLAIVKKANGTDATLKIGDKVKCRTGVSKYSNGVTMPAWVRIATLYVRAIEQNGKVLLVSTEPTKKVYTGRVYASDMQKI